MGGNFSGSKSIFISKLFDDSHTEFASFQFKWEVLSEERDSENWRKKKNILNIPSVLRICWWLSPGKVEKISFGWGAQTSPAVSFCFKSLNANLVLDADLSAPENYTWIFWRVQREKEEENFDFWELSSLPPDRERGSGNAFNNSAKFRDKRI